MFVAEKVLLLLVISLTDNWPVTTTNHLPPQLANYLGQQMVSAFV